MRHLRAVLAITAALTVAAPALADEWPSRPVRMVNTFAAGGTADVLTRMVADHLTAVFKQQFYVETRAGAGGVIGVKSVADSAPDGYNFALTNVSLLVLHPLSSPKLGYDPVKDLTNIAYVAGSPIVFSVNAKSGIRTMKEFVEYGKTSPKPLTYASSGLGSSGHLVGETFALKTGIKIEHVPYKGASQSLTDLAGGHIFFATQTLSSTAALIRGGTLTALAHTGKERLPDFPDVPTFKELGYDTTATVWFSISGPAGLPQDITQKMNREIVRAMQTPEAQRRLRQDGLVADPLSVEDFGKLIAQETVTWKPALERAGLLGTL